MTALGAAPYMDEVVCHDRDCDIYWERSQIWIVNHCHWRIQLSTDSVIMTYGQGSDQNYAFTVTKEPQTDGGYMIYLEPSHGSWAFGTSPNAKDVKRAFYYYIEHGVDLLADVRGLGPGLK
jgi:hypothetical protein